MEPNWNPLAVQSKGAHLRAALFFSGRNAAIKHPASMNALIMRNGGTQPSPIKAGKKMLPNRDPRRPNIISSETIIVLSEVGKRLTEALITDVADMLPMVTKSEASATVDAAELDQYIPMEQPAAMRSPLVIISLTPTKFTRNPASMYATKPAPATIRLLV